jgi:hypothetical protein
VHDKGKDLRSITLNILLCRRESTFKEFKGHTTWSGVYKHDTGISDSTVDRKILNQLSDFQLLTNDFLEWFKNGGHV